MELQVSLAGAAEMQAGWNAVVKGETDPFKAVTQVSRFSRGIALCVLPFVRVPAAVACGVRHSSHALPVHADRRSIGAGDMAQVYPTCEEQCR